MFQKFFYKRPYLKCNLKMSWTKKSHFQREVYPQHFKFFSTKACAISCRRLHLFSHLDFFLTYLKWF